MRRAGDGREEGGDPWRSLSPTCLSLNSVSLLLGWDEKSSKAEIKTIHRSELGDESVRHPEITPCYSDSALKCGQDLPAI